MLISQHFLATGSPISFFFFVSVTETFYFVFFSFCRKRLVIIQITGPLLFPSITATNHSNRSLIFYSLKTCFKDFWGKKEFSSGSSSIVPNLGVSSHVGAAPTSFGRLSFYD